jgi:hypothetical protein
MQYIRHALASSRHAPRHAHSIRAMRLPSRRWQLALRECHRASSVSLPIIVNDGRGLDK